MSPRHIPPEEEALFGRDADLALVVRRLQEVTGGRGRAMFIVGDKGIGKSSFLRACARMASDIAHVVGLDGSNYTEAAAIGGIIARLGTGRLHRPTLVVLDDFDKTSSQELETVDSLMQAVARLPVLIVAALRHRSVTFAPVAAIVNAALANGSSKHVLLPLRCSDVKLLVRNLAAARGCELEAAVTEEIIATAEGNPRFVRELVSQAVSESPARSALIPTSAVAEVGAFKSSISPAAGEVLSIASVVGGCFSGFWLAELSGRDDAIVSQALQAACDAGFLRELRDPPDSFVFTQYAMRKALSASFIVRQRNRLHSKIAQMLVRLEVKAPFDCLVAEHLAASDVDSASTLLQSAGSRMLDEGEDVAAARLYESAAHRIEESPNRVELLRTSARAYAKSGMLEHTLILHEELARLLRAGSSDDALAETLLSLFFDYAVAERWESARHTVEEISALHFSDPTDIRVYANMAWAIHLAQGRDAAQARSLFERAQMWLPTCARGKIMHLLGSAVVYSRGRPFQETMDLFDEAIRAAIQAHLAGFTAMSQILAFEVATTLGVLSAARDREAACRSALADVQHHKGLHNSYAIRHAAFCVLSGHLDTAREALRSILDVPNPGRAFEAFSQGNGTFIAARTGDRHTIQALFDPKLIDADTERHDAEAWGILLRGFAEIAVARGHASGLGACVHRLIEADFVDPHLWIQLTAAEYGWLDDVPAARKQILARADGTDRLVVEAALAMFDAYDARRQARRMKTTQAAIRAAKAYESLEWPIFQARALEIAGKLAAAATLYRKCGASADLERLQAVATKSKRRAAFSTPLTLREREVAAMLARGLTNNEIAAALRVSVQTIHHHVSAILGKLGLRSRWQVTPDVIQREP